MEKKIDVLIKGQGVVGLAVALHLSQRQLEIALSTEQVQPGTVPKQDARYYALNKASKEILDGIDCWPSGSDVTDLREMQIFGDEASELSFAPVNMNRPLAWIVKASSLNKKLLEKINLQPNITLAMDEGLNTHAPLTLICEGKHSAMRKKLGVEFDVSPYEQCAFATLIDTGSPHHGKALQWFIDGEGGAEILGMLPCEGNGSSKMSVIWSMPAPKASHYQNKTDVDISQALAEVTKHQFPNLQVLGPSTVWPLSASKAQQWIGHWSSNSAWALLGDSAHTVHPLAGMGLNLGLGDVAEMLKTLDLRQDKEYWRKLSDRYLLRKYERARKTDILSAWLFCDAIQRLFSHPSAVAKTLRNKGLIGVQKLTFIKSFFMLQAGS